MFKNALLEDSARLTLEYLNKVKREVNNGASLKGQGNEIAELMSLKQGLLVSEWLLIEAMETLKISVSFVRIITTRPMFLSSLSMTQASSMQLEGEGT